jgi:hypothetical protein
MLRWRAGPRCSATWHKSINNKKSKVIGKIKGVSAGPLPSSWPLASD